MSKLYWVLIHKGARWHAWHHGGDRSVCSYVTRLDLEDSPADQILNVLPPDLYAMACRVCAKKVGIFDITKAAGDEIVRAWEGYIYRHLSTVHARVAREHVRAIAELMAEVGYHTDEEAQVVWDQVRGFLLNPYYHRGVGAALSRIVRLKEALALMPRQARFLETLAKALTCWRSVTGLTSYGRYQLDRVVEVMLQVPDVEAYVKHLKARGLEHLGAVFHPNTLARAKREASLRGVFAGTSAYFEQTRDQLNVVEE